MVRVWIKTLAFVLFIVVPATLGTVLVVFLNLSRFLIGLNILVLAGVLLLIWVIAGWQAYWRFYAMAALPAYVVQYALTPAKLAKIFDEPESNFVVTRFNMLIYKSGSWNDKVLIVSRLRRHYGPVTIAPKHTNA
ncbi:hypothetical protein [Lacticaseibacillus sp. GG6-2]